MVLNEIFKNTGCTDSMTTLLGDFFSGAAIPLSFERWY